MITPKDWAGAFEQEYLASFLPDGGATVKFLAGEPLELAATRNAMAEAARRRNFLVVCLDGQSTRLHFVDKMFHAVAAQVDWERLARAVAERAVVACGYRPDASGDISVSAIAATMEIERNLVRNTVHSWLSKNLFSDSHMTREFRLAMMRLIDSHLDPPQAGRDGLAELSIEWLKGELRLVSALKGALIFRKIGRHNARDMLLSLMYWIRFAGHAGLVVVLDIGAYSVTQKALAEGNVYTRAATAELHEVLRQFVDAVDDMQGCAIIVLAPAGWAADEIRGLRMYRALQARVSDEVHGEHRDNPLGVLARVQQ
jgi:P-loop Domain of unknown function (DUF2791)